jgi:hypothetical protein
MTESVQLVAEPAGVVDDPVLDELTDEAEAEAELFAPMGAEPAAPAEENPDQTYSLVLAPPVAIDLRRALAGVAGHPQLALTEAFVGLPASVLLCHTMTPFALPGERPVPIWAMGYQVELLGVAAARTVSLVPASEVTTTATVSVSAGMRLEAGAGLDPLGLLNAVVPMPLPDVHLKASTDGQIRLELADFKVQAVRVIAGPVGAGGAMWQLYRHREVLNVSQVLLHVLALPAEVDQLTVRLSAWVSRRGLFGMKPENRTWRTPAQDFTISLAASPESGP